MESLPWVVAIVGFAALVRSTFGFGDALIGMPLLALLLPLRSATPLMAFVGPTLAILLLIREWRHLEVRSALRLILATLAGIPLGLFFLKRVDERAVNMALAVVIILFALYNLFRPGLLRLRTERSSWAFGFAAGVLGAAYNTNGPPVILYGVLRGWRPETFRATLQGYFLPTGTAILIGQGIAGLWTKPSSPGRPSPRRSSPRASTRPSTSSCSPRGRSYSPKPCSADPPAIRPGNGGREEANSGFRPKSVSLCDRHLCPERCPP